MLLVVSLASCASTADEDVAMAGDAAQGAASDVTVLENGTVEGLFSIEDLNIASYRIRGEGPDGAYFDWVEADTPRIALADIRRGEWTLYAQGLNAAGEPVVQGQLTTFLSENTPVDNLVFDESYGNGDVRCALAWNTAQVQHPSVEVYLQTDDGEMYPVDGEIVYGNGTAIWTAQGIPSGSYIARFILKDRSTPVSGAAAAMRVIDDKVSIGNVRLTIGDLSQVYGITLDNIPANTIEGDLVLGDDNNALFESENGDLLYDWYLDGTYLGTEVNGDSIPLSGLLKGYHRVDVVTRTADYGSINGDSIHIYTDGEMVQEIPEDEVNAAIPLFEATQANYDELVAGTDIDIDAGADEVETVAAEAVTVEAEPEAAV